MQPMHPESRGGNRKTECALFVLSCLLLVLGILLGHLFIPAQPSSGPRHKPLDVDPSTSQDSERPSQERSGTVTSEKTQPRNDATDVMSRKQSERREGTTSSAVPSLDDTPKNDLSSDPDSSVPVGQTKSGDKYDGNDILGDDSPQSLTGDHNAPEETRSVDESPDVTPKQNQQAVPDVSVQISADVPYNAHRVMAQPLDSQSYSLTGRLCGESRCFSQYNGRFNAVLVTYDNRVIIARYLQRILYVQSSSGEDIMSTTCIPVGLAQLVSGLIAVTCAGWNSMFLVSLKDTDAHIVQEIETKKMYAYVAVNPANNTLVTSPSGGRDLTIDVITLQGEVIRTLVDSSRAELKHVTSLTVAGDYVFVTDSAKDLLRISLSDTHQSGVETLRNPLIFSPISTAADNQGNIFIAQVLDVVMKTTDDRYRYVVERTDYNLAWSNFIVVHENRMLLVNWTLEPDESVMAEYALVDGDD